MRRVLRILRQAFDDQLAPRQLGEKPVDSAFTEDAKHRLQERIGREDKLNSALIIILASMLVVLFGVGVFLVVLHRNSPTLMASIFGGTCLSLLAIVDQLRRIWIQRTILDMSKGVLSGLPAEKAALFLRTQYYHLLGTNSNKSSKGKAT